MPSAVMLSGRARELGVFADVLGAARQSRPQVVFVEGEPGMGKTALLRRLCEPPAAGCRVRRVRCDAFEVDVFFGVAGLVLERWVTTGSEVDVGRQLLTQLGEWENGTDDVVVLVIDDGQWMDLASARALRFALRRLRADRVVTVIARRPVVGDDPWLGLVEDAADVTMLRLQPLEAVDVRDVALSLRGWKLSDEVAAQIVERSGGVPLLVEAILREPEDLAALRPGSALPASASAATRRVLAGIGDDVRLLVEAAAVFGEPTRLSVLGAAAGVDEPTAAVTGAVLAGLVTVDDDGTVECAHALMRDAVYATISPLPRRDLHQQAARWTTADRRLAHRVAACDRPDAVLTADLLAAASQARAGNQFDRAAQLGLQARQVAVDAAGAEQVLLRALLDRITAQNLPAADELEPAAVSCAEGPLRSLVLGVLASERGQIGPAKTLLAQAIRLAQQNGDELLLAEAGLMAANLQVALNEGPEALETSGLAMAAVNPEIAGQGLTLRGLALWQSGALDESLTLLGSVTVSSSGTSWEADLLAARAMVRCYGGQPDASVDDCDRALGLMHLWRPSSAQVRTYVQRSMNHYYLGDWDAAAVDASTARAVAAAGSQPWTLPLAQSISVQVPASRGQWELADQHLEDARESLARVPSVQVAGLIAAGAVQLALAR
ncbi:MAG: AAA family ATPase, partial [Janthinobacterium lividum]